MTFLNVRLTLTAEVFILYKEKMRDGHEGRRQRTVKFAIPIFSKGLQLY